jgi:hypothetical protein
MVLKNKKQHTDTLPYTHTDALLKRGQLAQRARCPNRETSIRQTF